MADPFVQAVSELVQLPIGDLLRSVALGIAEAQFQLDKASMTVAELMSGQRLLRDLDTGRLLTVDGQPTDKPVMIDSRVYFGYYIEDGKRIANKLSMMELGFTPTFYQFVDTVIELKIAVRMTQAERKQTPVNAGGKSPGSAAAGVVGAAGAAGWWTGSGGDDFVLTSTPVDAAYSSAYSYKAEFASVVKTKLVPIPPPAVLEERIRLFLEERRAEREEATKARKLPSGKEQITEVAISVAKTRSGEIELDVRSGGQKVAPGQELKIKTVPNDPEETAEQLANELNVKVPQLLKARAVSDKVVIEFKDERAYEVTQVDPRPGSKSFVTVTTLRQPPAAGSPSPAPADDSRTTTEAS